MQNTKHKHTKDEINNSKSKNKMKAIITHNYRNERNCTHKLLKQK